MKFSKNKLLQKHKEENFSKKGDKNFFSSLKFHEIFSKYVE